MIIRKLFKIAMTSTIALSILSVAGCNNGGSWSEATGTISGVTKVDNNKYGYRISYEAPASTAVNKEGKPIKHIDQFIFIDHQPQDNQHVRLRYERTEPMFYKLIEPLKSVNPKAH